MLFSSHFNPCEHLLPKETAQHRQTHWSQILPVPSTIVSPFTWRYKMHEKEESKKSTPKCTLNSAQTRTHSRTHRVARQQKLRYFLGVDLKASLSTMWTCEGSTSRFSTLSAARQVDFFLLSTPENGAESRQALLVSRASQQYTEAQVTKRT